MCFCHLRMSLLISTEGAGPLQSHFHVFVWQVNFVRLSATLTDCTENNLIKKCTERVCVVLVLLIYVDLNSLSTGHEEANIFQILSLEHF